MREVVDLGGIMSFYLCFSVGIKSYKLRFRILVWLDDWIILIVICLITFLFGEFLFWSYK